MTTQPQDPVRQAHADAHHGLHCGVVVGAERVLGFDVGTPQVLVDVALATVSYDVGGADFGGFCAKKPAAASASRRPAR